MYIKRLPLGEVQANCYVLCDEETKVGAVVDVGELSQELLLEIKAAGIKELKYILCTHGHFDHMLGVEKFRQEFNAKVVVQSADEDKLSSAEKSLYSRFDRYNPFMATSADIVVKDGDSIPFGNEAIEVIHTPGHTKGGVCYKVRDLLFTGDTLFKGTIGRTDFPDSDEMEMLESLIRLDKLDMNYKIYPGHDGVTTLDFEKQTNKYMKLAHKRADK